MERLGALNAKTPTDRSKNGNECGQRKIHGMFQATGPSLGGKQRNSEGNMRTQWQENPVASLPRAELLSVFLKGLITQ